MVGHLNTLYVVVSAVGVIESFLFALVLLRLSRNKYANGFLSLYFVCAGICVLINLLLTQYTAQGIPVNDSLAVHVIHFTFLILLLKGPLLILYSMSLLYPEFRYSKRYNIQFIVPPLFAVMCYIPYYAYVNINQDVSQYINSDIMVIIKISFFLIIFGYMMFIKSKIREYKKNLKSLENIGPCKWLGLITTLYSILCYVHIFNIIYIKYYSSKPSLLENIEFIMSPVVSTTMVLLLFFYAVVKPELLYSLRANLRGVEGMSKYRTSPLKVSEINEIMKATSQIIRNEKLYADPEFKVDELAKRLNINKNYLSQVINTATGMSVPEYLNNLRINEFIEIMKQETNFNFLNLAMKVGFNSKPSFNRAFKKHIGLTPSEFMRGISNVKENGGSVDSIVQGALIARRASI